MALKQMTISKENVVALDPKAEAKFATPSIAGRVLNIDCETDGTGTAEIQLKHPDGSVETLATVTAPVFSKDQRMALQVRVATSIREPKTVEVK